MFDTSLKYKWSYLFYIQARFYVLPFALKLNIMPTILLPWIGTGLGMGYDSKMKQYTHRCIQMYFGTV